MKSRIVKEEWRFIPEFEGYYQMSNLCRFRSVDRVVPVNCSKKNQNEALYKGKIIKQKPDKGGYWRVPLTKEHKCKRYSVTRLLAITFPELIDWTEDAKGKSIKELEINHKNECKWDNNYWNLEWCTKDYNHNYGTRNERAIKHFKKVVEQYTLDGVFIAEYPSVTEASVKTGVYWQSISACCRNYRNQTTAGGYIWKYKVAQ